MAGAKLGIDGSPQGFTAWRDRPYYAPVGGYPKGYSGYTSATNEQTLEAIGWAYANDMQVIAHANGEAASDQLIAAHTVAQLQYGAAKGRQPGAHPRPVPARGPGRRLPTAGRAAIAVPDAPFYWGDWTASKTVGPKFARTFRPPAGYASAG